MSGRDLTPPGAGRGAREDEPNEGRDAGGARRRAEFIAVTGVVQGVGFRPFVYGLARRLGVLGWVRNTSAGVEIHAEATPDVLDAFARAVEDEAPPRAFVATLTRAAAPLEEHDSFVITESAPDPDAYQLVSPDIATCADCRRELLDPADRRYRYPFINCTNCGPRFTIIEDVPYDRPRTTMRDFPMCPACAARVRRPGGPALPRPAERLPGLRARGCTWTCGRAPSRRDRGTERRTPSRDPRRRRGAEPPRTDADPSLPRTAGELLCATATSSPSRASAASISPATRPTSAVVRRLRERKHRCDKPLAVMFRDLDELREHCRRRRRGGCAADGARAPDRAAALA